MTRSARRSAPSRPVTAVSEQGEAPTAGETTNGATPAPMKPGRHREATLYHALAGAGAGDGRDLQQLREAALEAYDSSELPVWRRSGFWTTSLQSLGLDALVTQPSPTPAAVPDVVTRTLADRPRAGRIVQSAGTVVHVELDAELAAKGVILCSLEDAFRDHGELVAEWYSKRLTIDRNKLEAANAAFWTGGAFLHVPQGLVVEDPFEIVYAIESSRGSRSTGARSSSAPRRASSACTSTTSRRGLRRAGAARRARSSSTCRTARAAAWRRSQDWGSGEVFDVSTRVRRRRARRLLPLAAGAARRPSRAPAPGARGVRARRRHGLPRTVLHRGARASGRVRGRPARDRPVGRRRALARRGDAARAARASRA